MGQNNILLNFSFLRTKLLNKNLKNIDDFFSQTPFLCFSVISNPMTHLTPNDQNTNKWTQNQRALG